MSTLGPAYEGQSPDDYDSGVYSFANSGLVGQCTWYANGRSAVLCGSWAPKGAKGHWNNADQWASNYGGGWRLGSRDEAHAGAVLIDTSNVHVAVVEARASDGGLVYSHFNGYSSGGGYTLRGRAQGVSYPGDRFNRILVYSGVAGSIPISGRPGGSRGHYEMIPYEITHQGVTQNWQIEKNLPDYAEKVTNEDKIKVTKRFNYKRKQWSWWEDDSGSLYDLIKEGNEFQMRDS